MALLAGAFGRYLGYEGPLNCLYKKTFMETPSPFQLVRTQQEVCDPKVGSHLTMLELQSGTFSLQNYKQSISVIYELPSLFYFVIAARIGLSKYKTMFSKSVC